MRPQTKLQSIRPSVLLIIGSLFLFTAPMLAEELDKEVDEKLTEAVLEWLSHVDGGNYGDSWSSSGSFFRSQVTEVQWITQLSRTRAPLGRPSDRVQKNVVRLEEVPGAPPGEYMVIQFTVTFGKATATETVTTMVDEDGEWRVVGYSIQ